MAVRRGRSSWQSARCPANFLDSPFEVDLFIEAVGFNCGRLGVRIAARSIDSTPESFHVVPAFRAICAPSRDKRSLCLCSLCVSLLSFS